MKGTLLLQGLAALCVLECVGAQYVPGHYHPMVAAVSVCLSVCLLQGCSVLKFGRCAITHHAVPSTHHACKPLEYRTA